MTRSPIRFPGSKFQALKILRPFLETTEHDEYREPFLGGGAVFFSKPRVKYNWLNDVDPELITTFRIIANPKLRKELIKRVVKEKANKSNFERIKSWEPKTKMEIAHRYFFINRTAYSGIMKQPNWGYHPQKSVPPKKWGSRIEGAGEKLEDVKITCLDFEEVIKAPPRGKLVFLFIDPPYLETDQKRAYRFSFQRKDHLRLKKLLKRTKYKFCLTYDNCDGARKLYSWAYQFPASWRYHTANATKATRKMGKELIITNYQLNKARLSMFNRD